MRDGLALSLVSGLVDSIGDTDEGGEEFEL
jgi:hypothetical protein